MPDDIKAIREELLKKDPDFESIPDDEMRRRCTDAMSSAFNPVLFRTMASDIDNPPTMPEGENLDALRMFSDAYSDDSQQKTYEDFFLRNPQAMADIIQAELSLDARKVLRVIMTDGTPELFPVHIKSIPSVDFWDIYKNYDDQGKRIVDEALASNRLMLSRRYVLARWVNGGKTTFLESMGEHEIEVVRRAALFEQLPENEWDRAFFLAFCAVFQAVDDDAQDAMEDVAGDRGSKLSAFIRHRVTVPDFMDFGKVTKPKKVDESIQDESSSDESPADIVPKFDRGTGIRSPGIEISTCDFVREIIRNTPNKSFVMPFKRHNKVLSNITIKFTRPVDETGNPIPYTKMDQGIVDAWNSLLAMGRTEATDADIYRQWMHDFSSNVSKECLDVVCHVMEHAMNSSTSFSGSNLKNIKELPNIITTIGNLVNARRERRMVNGHEIYVWVALTAKRDTLADLSRAMDLTHFVGDEKILNVKKIGMRALRVRKSGSSDLMIMDASMRDMILTELYAIAAIKAKKDKDGKIIKEGHTGFISLAYILVKNGFSQILQRGREFKNNYEIRKKLYAFMVDYLDVLKKEGYILELSKRDDPSEIVIFDIKTRPDFENAVRSGKSGFFQPSLDFPEEQQNSDSN